MKNFTIAPKNFVLSIENFGDWALPDDAADRVLDVDDLPAHESWCDQEFADAVNQQITVLIDAVNQKGN